MLDETSALDQPVYSLKSAPQNTYFIELADRVIGQSLEEGSFDFAFATLEAFRVVNKSSSLGTCRLLHGVKSNWDLVPHEESFIQSAMRKTGYSQLTIERYISVWELLTGDYIPEEFKENIWSHTMRQLVKEASLVIDQGYQLEHDDWRDLSEAIDEHRVAEICAKVKDKPRNSNHMSLKIDEQGYIFAYQGEDNVVVGSLWINSTEPLISKACRRIMNSSGITKRSDY